MSAGRLTVVRKQAGEIKWPTTDGKGNGAPAKHERDRRRMSDVDRAPVKSESCSPSTTVASMSLASSPSPTAVDDAHGSSPRSQSSASSSSSSSSPTAEVKTPTVMSNVWGNSPSTDMCDSPSKDMVMGTHQPRTQKFMVPLGAFEPSASADRDSAADDNDAATNERPYFILTFHLISTTTSTGAQRAQSDYIIECPTESVEFCPDRKGLRTVVQLDAYGRVLDSFGGLPAVIELSSIRAHGQGHSHGPWVMAVSGHCLFLMPNAPYHVRSLVKDTMISRVQSSETLDSRLFGRPFRTQDWLLLHDHINVSPKKRVLLAS